MLDRRQRRFSFSHRSFLEYFVAQHFRRSLARNDDDLDEFLRLVVDDRAYLVGVMTLQAMGVGADRLFGRILDEFTGPSTAERVSDELEFVAEAIVQVDLHGRVVARAVRFLVERTASYSVPTTPDELARAEPYDLLGDYLSDANISRLMAARPENRRAVEETLREMLSNCPDTRELLSLTGLLAASWESEHPTAGKVVDAARDLVGARVLGPDGGVDLAHVAVLLRLSPPGAVAAKYGSEMIARTFGGLTPLEILLAILVDRPRFGTLEELALATLVECAASGRITVPRPAAVRACEMGESGDARDVSYLHLESFTFDDFSDAGRALTLGCVARLAVDLRRRSLIHRSCLWLRSLLEDDELGDEGLVLPLSAQDLETMISSAVEGADPGEFDLIAHRAFHITEIVE